MTPAARPGPPPRPPENLSVRDLPLVSIEPGSLLYRIHRSAVDPVYFGRENDPIRRQRWDAPGASYGVYYLALDPHIAFGETMLRDLRLDSVDPVDLALRSLAVVELKRELKLVPMGDEHLHRLGADESVVQGSYDLTGHWSAALHAHPEKPDGIRYRARHDSSGYAAALFDRAAGKVRIVSSAPLTSADLTVELARWLDCYDVGLTS